MNKIKEILIILIFVFSLGFLLFTAKTIDRIETQKKLIVSLQDNISSLQNTINSLEGTINTATGKIDSLKAEVNRVEEELSLAIEEKKKAEEELAVVQDENKKLSSELNEAKEKVSVLTQRTTKLEKESTTLSQMITELEDKLNDTENKLSITEDKLAKLESVGILVDRPAISPGAGRIPKIVKAIEGEVVDVKPTGVVAINFKGSIKPQKGTTFYITNSDEVHAKLTLEEIYNTIMVARMEIEQGDYNIKEGDEVRLILWTEEKN